MRLFTIGDSVSQGFMSGAAARAELAYSTLVARALGAEDYRYPEYPSGGLFVPIEPALRRLQRRFDVDIKGPIEWPRAVTELGRVLDASEDYYERGAGAIGSPDLSGHHWFHNVASFGMTVADAWLLTPKVCREQIEEVGGSLGDGDDLLGIASKSFYRSALHVLNPSKNFEEYGDHSALKWLEHHAQRGDGVENVALWLGANNALGCVLWLDVRQSPSSIDPSLTHAGREQRRWTLYHPEAFKADYSELLDRVDEAMEKNKEEDWRVFLGTIPALTILPLAKGLGPTTPVVIPGKAKPLLYYKYYAYFPFEVGAIREGVEHLTMEEAVHIDAVIRAYNDSIKALAAEHNATHKKKRYHVVDIADQFDAIAYKRNDGRPTYQWPDALRWRFPKVNTKYYHADRRGRLRQGGLFSLDGVHPTAIGQGLMARSFLDAMGAVGVQTNDNIKASGDLLDWDAIYASDELYSRPIGLMQEVYEHEHLLRWILRSVSAVGASREH